MRKVAGNSEEDVMRLHKILYIGEALLLLRPRCLPFVVDFLIS